MSKTYTILHEKLEGVQRYKHQVQIKLTDVIETYMLISLKSVQTTAANPMSAFSESPSQLNPPPYYINI